MKIFYTSVPSPWENSQKKKRLTESKNKLLCYINSCDGFQTCNHSQKLSMKQTISVVILYLCPNPNTRIFSVQPEKKGLGSHM